VRSDEPGGTGRRRVALSCQRSQEVITEAIVAALPGCAATVVHGSLLGGPWNMEVVAPRPDTPRSVRCSELTTRETRRRGLEAVVTGMLAQAP
jgi:hypothetical protein